MTMDYVSTHASGPANVSGQRRVPRGRTGEYLGSRSHEAALEGLHAGLREDVELLVLIGEPGAGKTTALHRLAQELSGIAACVYCPASGLDFAQVLGVVCDDLGVPFRAPEQRAALEALTGSLAGSSAGPLVLMVDDADRMHGDALEQLLKLSRAILRRRRRLHFVLSGQPALQARLRRVRATYPPVSRAVFARLTRLGSAEVATLLGRLAQTRVAAGAPGAPPAAIRRIGELGQGVPGRTVALFDAAVNMAARAGHTSLSPALVDHAAASLKEGGAPATSRPPEPVQAATPTEPGRPDARRNEAPSLLAARWRMPAAVAAVAAVMVAATLLFGTRFGGEAGTQAPARQPRVAALAGDAQAREGDPRAAATAPRQPANGRAPSARTAAYTPALPAAAQAAATEAPRAEAAQADREASIRRAWAAFNRNALTTPANDNAVRWARSVLVAAPSDARAREVIEAVIDRYLNWSDSNLRQLDAREAGQYLSRARSLEAYATPEQAAAMEVLDGEVSLLERRTARDSARRQRQYQRDYERSPGRSRGAPPTDGPKWIRDIDRWLRTLPLPKDG